MPTFAAIDDRTLLRIVGASANLTWSANTVIFEKGSVAEALFIILSGRVRILDVVDDEQIEIATLEPGDFFGELALLLHTVHSKTAMALDDSELMVLPKDSFQELLASNPELAGQFRRTLETRLSVPEAARLT